MVLPENLFSETRTAFKLLGLWNPNPYPYWLIPFVWILRIFVNFCIGIGLCLCCLVESMFYYSEGNIDRCLNGINFFLSYSIIYQKIFLILTKQKAIEDCIFALEENAKLYSDTRHIERNWRNIRRLFFSATILVELTVISYGLASLTHAFGSEPTTIYLPIRVDIVFDLSGSLSFVLFFLYEQVALITCPLLMMAHDMIFCGIMSMCEAMLQTLDDEVHNLNISMRNSKTNHSDELKRIIKSFSKVLSIIDMAREIFTTGALAHFLYCFTGIGFCIYEMSKLALSNPKFISMTLGATTASFQLLLYCYIGQSVTTNANNLRESFYDNEWYSQPKEFKQMILFTLHRIEHEPVFTAGNIIPLSRESFAQVMKACFTYYTFLKQTG